MTINEDQKQLERFKESMDKEQVDLSNGLCRNSSKNWKFFQRMYKLSKIKILHFERNQNPSILLQISHIRFSNVKRLLLQSNKILNIQILGWLDFPNLQELDLLKNKISNINSIEKWKFNQLKTIKLSIDCVSSGWVNVYRGQTSLDFMLLDSFYSKNSPIVYSKLKFLTKSANVKELTFKNGERRESSRLVQYVKECKFKKK